MMINLLVNKDKKQICKLPVEVCQDIERCKWKHVVEISFNGRAAAADQKWGLTWDRDDPCMTMPTYTKGADGLLVKSTTVYDSRYGESGMVSATNC